MGEVYRGRDTRPGRVAIKILPELFVADPERVARLRAKRGRYADAPVKTEVHKEMEGRKMSKWLVAYGWGLTSR